MSLIMLLVGIIWGIPLLLAAVLILANLVSSHARTWISEQLFPSIEWDNRPDKY
jgi:hypothetical protein